MVEERNASEDWKKGYSFGFKVGLLTAHDNLKNLIEVYKKIIKEE